MAYVLIYAINYGLGVVGQEMVMDLVSGLPADSPLHGCGTVCLLVGPKMVHVCCKKILLNMNGLECVWKETVNE